MWLIKHEIVIASSNIIIMLTFLFSLLSYLIYSDEIMPSESFFDQANVCGTQVEESQ